MSQTVPAAAIIDDGSPVNLMYFHDLTRKRTLLPPLKFVRHFASVCTENGITGKFSLVPMPAGLGRIDKQLNLVAKRHLTEFLNIVRQEIAPCFSLTPEILTHYCAYDIEHDRYFHLMEDEYIARLDSDGIARYVGFALEILCSMGFEPTGLTSPWATGDRNENQYAAGIGKAFKKIRNQDVSFYFLHSSEEGTSPQIACNGPDTGKVVSIFSNCDDPFWNTQSEFTARKATANVKNSIDNILSEDGRTGRFRDLFERGLPLIFTTHWQSLFSEGREIGLLGLETLARRINKVFGNAIEWTPFYELAKATK